MGNKSTLKAILNVTVAKIATGLISRRVTFRVKVHKRPRTQFERQDLLHNCTTIKS